MCVETWDANYEVGVCLRLVDRFSFQHAVPFINERCGLIVNRFIVDSGGKDYLVEHPERVRVDLAGHEERLCDARERYCDLVENAICFSDSFYCRFPVVPRSLPIRHVNVRVNGIVPILSFRYRLLEVNRYQFSVLVLLLRFGRVQVQFTNYVSRPIAARVTGTKRVLQAVVPAVAPVPFAVLVCLTRELVRPVPSAASLGGQFNFRCVRVFLWSSTAVARDVRVLYRSREAVSFEFYLTNVNRRFFRTTVRATVSVNVVVLFNPFVLCEAAFLR